MSGFLPSLPMHELQSGEVIRVLLRRAQDLVAGHSPHCSFTTGTYLFPLWQELEWLHPPISPSSSSGR